MYEQHHDTLAGDDEHEHDDGDDPGDDKPVDGSVFLPGAEAATAPQRASAGNRTISHALMVEKADNRTVGALRTRYHVTVRRFGFPYRCGSSHGAAA